MASPNNVTEFTVLLKAIHVHAPGDSEVKNPPANAGDASLIRESGRSPGAENDTPFHDFCLAYPMDKGTYSPWSHRSPWDHKRIEYDLVTKQTGMPYETTFYPI